MGKTNKLGLNTKEVGISYSSQLSGENYNWNKIDGVLGVNNPVWGYQAVNSTNTKQTFTLDDNSFYLVLVTGVLIQSTGYVGLISSSGGYLYVTDIFKSSTISTGNLGLNFTINPTAYVRIQIIKLKTL